MVTEKQKQLLSALYGERGIFREKEPMAPHTTFRIGGPAEVYLVPADEEQLAATVRLLRGEGMRWQILGNGSNVLVADEGSEACSFIWKIRRACRSTARKAAWCWRR